MAQANRIGLAPNSFRELERAVGVEEDGYGAVVDEFHFHHGAEDAALDAQRPRS